MIKNAFFVAGLLLLGYGYGLMDKLHQPLALGGQATDLIPIVNSDEILAQVNSGAKVVFIDAREPAEFEEDHLPGAFNMTLREVPDAVASRFNDADLVVTYCLKDFRGYELGRALQVRGLHNVKLMKDHGINGWKKNGLPVAGQRGLTEAKALARLHVCAQDKNQCPQKSAS
ncbi:rhodanese-like domain-containing protein [Methylomonas methanica]|uniref:Rhodanese-like protein n=1 Tax=Methylomonas methanica (strain DSM 25384 / MC09) TaxID=857087 RepID=G0A194_METMM|nr:rhodanese-like domain-containing protein [Methylomonas methanica]AEG02514.1 Rhodanese-like protein [Methylomonas methanica MC09]